MRNGAVASLVLFSSLACACGASPGEATGTPPATAEPAITAAVEVTPPVELEHAAAPSLYEVHEWGVIDVQEDGRAEVAAGGRMPVPLARPVPPPSHPPMPMRKPVLYFHLTEGIDLLGVEVSARLPSGTIYETFPPDTRPSPEVAHWAVTLTPPHCATITDVVTRGPGGPVSCTTPDGICEVTELLRYDAASASCVETGGIRAGMLFYRGMATPVLPLAVERASDMSVTVTATGPTAGAPGMLLRVSTNLAGRWPAGRVVVSRAAVPTQGASVTLPVGTVEIDRVASRAELASSLAALGMDEAETNAFLGAWSTAIWGPEPGASGRASEGFGPIPQDSVVYFLPEAAVDAMSHLELSPTPGRVRRAFMVRVILPAVETD